MRKMKNLLIYFLLFILLVSNVFSAQELLDFNETFETVSFFNVQRADLDNVSVITTSTSDSFTGEIGVWFVGFLDNVFAEAGNMTISSFWSQGGTRQARLDGGSNSQAFVFFHIFDDLLTFTNDSEIISIANATDNSNLIFILSNTSNECVFAYFTSIFVTSIAEGYCPNGIPFICTQGDSIMSGSPQKFNTSIGNCTLSNPDFENINKVAVMGNDVTVGGQLIFFDNIEFQNVLNGSNELPRFNISLNSTVQCINQTGQSTNFSIIIDTFDPENDTVLYSTQILEKKNFNRTVKYNQEDCGIFGLNCKNVKDTSFITNAVFPTIISGNPPTLQTVCPINIGDTINLSQFNIVEFPDQDGDDVFALSMSSACGADDNSFYYRLDNAITNVFYFTEILGFRETSEVFQISFFDNFITDELIRLRFTNNGGTNLLIEEFDGVSFSTIGNPVFDFENNTVKLSINWFGNESTNFIIVSDIVGGVFNFSSINADILVKYIRLTVGGTTLIYQKDFTFSGIFPTPDFSEAVINNITLSRIGLTYVNFFISDDAHESSQFVTQRIPFNVVECSNFVPPLRDRPGFKIFTLFTVLKSTINKVCVPLDSIFLQSNYGAGANRFGVCFTIRAVYFMFGFLLSILIGFVFKVLMSGQIGYISFATTFFVFGIFGGYLFDLSVTSIFLFILLGLSGIIILLRTYIMGDSADGGGFG